MKKASAIISISLFVAVGNARAQSFDPTWSARFQFVLDSICDANNARGASLGVYVPGQGVWIGVHGDSHAGVPITQGMRMGIASNTKTFVAALVMKLQEQGILLLDDPISNFMPAYLNIDGSATIRQLLSHQTGFYDFLNDQYVATMDSIWADPARFWTPEEVLGMIGAPHFAPGHGYQYSNTNYLLLGMVIESATGIGWAQKLREEILDPLNMDSTFVGSYEAANGPVAHQWAANNSVEIPASPMNSMYSMMGPAAAMFSVPSELIQFYNALFNGGLLTNASLQEMLSVDPTSLYGAGVQVAPFDDPFFYHTGSMDGYESSMDRSERTGAIICILTNGGFTPNTFLPQMFFPLLSVLRNEYPLQPNDAGVAGIIAPTQARCTGTIIPEVSLTNFGSSTLTSVNIHSRVDADVPTSFSWSGSLPSGGTIAVQLPMITVAEGSHTFIAYTSAPNGGAEGYANNDTARSVFIMEPDIALSTPFDEGFEGGEFPPIGWVRSTITPLQWGRTTLASYSGATCLARGNRYDVLNFGRSYDIDMPLLNLTGTDDSTLYFSHSYRNAPGGRNDSLRVLISADCGDTWQTVFYQGGNQLRTVGTASFTEFYPSGPAQWRSNVIPLTGYTGDVLIRFRSINRNGNNLFIDDVSVHQFVGMGEAALAPAFLVYPNPATDEMTIVREGSGQMTYQLIDVTGRLAEQGSMTADRQVLRTGALERGTYLLRVQGDGTFASQRIVLQ